MMINYKQYNALLFATTCISNFFPSSFLRSCSSIIYSISHFNPKVFIKDKTKHLDEKEQKTLQEIRDIALEICDQMKYPHDKSLNVIVSEKIDNHAINIGSNWCIGGTVLQIDKEMLDKYKQTPLRIDRWQSFFDTVPDSVEEIEKLIDSLSTEEKAELLSQYHENSAYLSDAELKGLLSYEISRAKICAYHSNLGVAAIFVTTLTTLNIALKRLGMLPLAPLLSNSLAFMIPSSLIYALSRYDNDVEKDIFHLCKTEEKAYKGLKTLLKKRYVIHHLEKEREPRTLYRVVRDFFYPANVDNHYKVFKNVEDHKDLTPYSFAKDIGTLGAIATTVMFCINLNKIYSSFQTN